MSPFRWSPFCCLAITLFTLAAPLAAQETLRVPKDFATIQAAVNSANDGDTVLISKGTYTELVEIVGFDGLTLIGKGKPVLQGDFVITGAEGEEAFGGLVISNSSNVLVKGLVARDSFETSGFTVSSSSGVTLQSCRVEQPVNEAGISVFSSSDVVIDRCRVTGQGGAELPEGDGIFGINISSSTDISILKARIQDVSGDGIHSASSGPVTIEKCRLKNIGGDGIHGSSNVMGGLIFVDRCRLSDLGDDGIETSGAMTDLQVSKTRIARTGDDGLDAGGRAVTLDKVSLTDCEAEGFKISPIATLPRVIEGEPVEGPVLMTNCRAKRVEEDGLDLRADGAVVTNFKLNTVGDDALRVADCSGVVITKVRLGKIESKGLQLFGVTDSNFVDFRMSKPDDGVFIDFMSEGNLFEAWKVTAPEGDGFDIDGANNEFFENTVNKAGNYGFTVITSGNIFTGNKTKGSGNAGLQDTAGKGANTYTDNNFDSTEGL